MMKKTLYLLSIPVLISCGSTEEQIKADMDEHCKCVSEKGFKNSECMEIMESIALKYQDEEGAADIIREESIKCGEKMMQDGKDDATIRVR